MNTKALFAPLIPIILLTGCLNSNDPNNEIVNEEEFLSENAQMEDITVTDSGLQYRIIESVEGESPASESVVFVEFEGNLISGDIFTNSNGIEYFTLSSVIPGLREGIQLMTTGSTYEFFLPTELGYGNNPPAGSIIRPGSVLIIEVTLDSFLEDPDQFLAENSQLEDITVTESGLQYRVIEAGNETTPGPEDQVLVNYKGTFTNDFVFDESPDGSPATFTVSGVIPGFAEGLQLMGEGASYEFFIPSEIGYEFEGITPPPGIPAGAIV
ncbi:MAG: FKBP-type peptidyl-prolyl cis-trans isomerase, partial [Balneolaceae bacterium]